MRTVALFRSMPWPVKLLLINQTGISIGFYLLIPYLAVHLTGDLGFSAAVVGVVLGVRSFAQQGLGFVGGAAADRFGCRPVILAGCGLRVVAFGTFALSADAAGLIVASLVTGLAGALFSPALRTYLALEAPSRRVGAFALHALSNTIGALAGPLLGSVLIMVTGFRTMALFSAVIFALLTVAQAIWLPARAPVPQERGSWRMVLRDRRFLAFAIACSCILTLYNQFYLLLPMEAVRATGWAGATGAVFLLSAVLTLAWQVRLTETMAGRRPVELGLLTSALAFLPGAIGVTWLHGAWAMLAVGLATALLSLGMDLAQPFALDTAASFAPPGLTGTYLGVYGTAAGLVATAGNAGVGALSDLGTRIDLAALPWLGLALVAACGAAAVAVLRPS